MKECQKQFILNRLYADGCVLYTCTKQNLAIKINCNVLRQKDLKKLDAKCFKSISPYCRECK